MTKTRTTAPVHLAFGIAFAVIGMAFAAAVSISAPDLSQNILLAAAGDSAGPAIQLSAEAQTIAR